MISLKIGHRDYTVELHPTIPETDGVKLIGQCRNNDGKILLDASLTGSRKAEILLHEVLHACWYFGCLGEECEEERAVDVLASCLVMIQRDNPWFLPALTKLTAGKSVPI